MESSFGEVFMSIFKNQWKSLIYFLVHGEKYRCLPHFDGWTVQSFSITIPGAISNITATGWMISAELAKTFLSYVCDTALVVIRKLRCKLKTLHPMNVHKWEVKLRRKKKLKQVITTGSIHLMCKATQYAAFCIQENLSIPIF